MARTPGGCTDGNADPALDNACMGESLSERAHAIVEGHCGGGVIGLPEVKESFERALSLGESAATDLAIEVLSEFCGSERFRVHRGRALDDPPPVDRREERALIEERVAYGYGDGDEVRTWFSLDCLSAR